ncbi:hypothetical protein BH10PSE16_BH10PSE16_28390 [soil metagenome]
MNTIALKPGASSLEPESKVTFVTAQQIQAGAVFSNGHVQVVVGMGPGLSAKDLRLDKFPRDGLVHAPWFRDAGVLAEHLNRGGHVDGGPAFYLATE